MSPVQSADYQYESSYPEVPVYFEDYAKPDKALAGDGNNYGSGNGNNSIVKSPNYNGTKEEEEMMLKYARSGNISSSVIDSDYNAENKNVGIVNPIEIDADYSSTSRVLNQDKAQGEKNKRKSILNDYEEKFSDLGNPVKTEKLFRHVSLKGYICICQKNNFRDFFKGSFQKRI